MTTTVTKTTYIEVYEKHRELVNPFDKKYKNATHVVLIVEVTRDFVPAIEDTPLLGGMMRRVDEESVEITRNVLRTVPVAAEAGVTVGQLKFIAREKVAKLPRGAVEWDTYYDQEYVRENARRTGRPVCLARATVSQ